MRRRIVSVFIAILILFSITTTAFAGGSSYHNKILTRMLFSSGHCQSANQVNAELYIEMLQNAVYLTVDQSGNKTGDQDKLNLLLNNGVKGIAENISILNPEVAFMHRSYTHRGWDWVYTDDKSNWSARKTILYNTVNTIFDFEKHSGSSSEATRKCDALCKILYYQHVLGDLIYDDKDTLQLNSTVSDSDAEFNEKERGLIIAFAYAHPGSTNRDIFWELKGAVETLFANQKNSYKYSGFMTQFNSLATEARALAAMTGGVNSAERVQQRLGYEEELLELLESYMPLLLDDEAFFRATFPI